MRQLSNIFACDRAILPSVRSEHYEVMKTTFEKEGSGHIAVIGAGYWGVNHVRNFHELGALRMVCDNNESSLEKIAERFPGVRIETDITTALASSDVRGVVIATPAETHYPIASAAIEAGKDVLVEKPLAGDPESAATALAAAKSAGVVLMVGYQKHADADVSYIGELIESNRLGQLMGLTSVFQQQLGSLALAKRIKERAPETVIVMGGANCEATMGVETVRQFTFVDAIV